MKLLVAEYEVDVKNVILGALAGTVFDMTIDIPLDQAGLLASWDIADDLGNYVWGVGTGDIFCAGIGVGMTALGEFALKNKSLKEAGLGWLVALGLHKLAEFGSYIWWNMYKGMKLVPTPILGSVATGSVTARKFIPGVLMPKYQQGNGNPVSLARKAAMAGGGRVGTAYPGTYAPTRPGLSAVVGTRPRTRAVPVREMVGPYAGGLTAPKFVPGPLRPKYQLGA